MPKKYAADDTLTDIVQQILRSGHFSEAMNFTIKALYARGSPPGYREAASCHKMSEAVRAVSGVDFILIFWTTPWNAATVEERQVLLVHELHHIAVKDGKPALRRHAGDFCEIPKHDRFCVELAKKIPIPPMLRKGSLVQTTLFEVAEVS